MQQQYPIPQQQVQMQQGRYFRYPLPQGWRVNETDSGVDLTAPDGLTLVSHAITRGPGQMTPDQMLRIVAGYAPQMGITNLRVVASRNVAVPANGQAIAYELAYEVRGMPVQAIGIYRVFNNFGGYVVDATTIQGPPQTFCRDVPALMQLDQSIAVTNPNQVCGNDRLIRYQPPPVPTVGASLNPVGDMIVKGEQERNRERDNTFQHTVDVTRGVTRWGDDGSIVAPNTAERVFETPGGKAIYSNNPTTPPPPNTAEVDPYKYGKK